MPIITITTTTTTTTTIADHTVCGTIPKKFSDAVFICCDKLVNLQPGNTCDKHE